MGSCSDDFPDEGVEEAVGEACGVGVFLSAVEPTCRASGRVKSGRLTTDGIFPLEIAGEWGTANCGCCSGDAALTAGTPIPLVNNMEERTRMFSTLIPADSKCR